MPIAIAAVGALGVAGGIFGGMQQASQQKAQYMANKIQVERNNFLQGMQNDRQTEAMAQKNVNSRLQDQAIAEAASANRFYANWQNQKQTDDAKEMTYQASRAAQATLESQMTGQMGNVSGGTATALRKQEAQAERERMHQIAMKKYETEEGIVQNYENMMGQRSLGIDNQVNSAFIPGSTGIAPSSSGAMLNGLFSGLSGGLGMASGMKGLMS